MERFAVALGDTDIDFIEKIPGRFWGYGYLRSRSEKIVAAGLAAKGRTYYLPLMPRARLHHGTKVVSQVPMIAGYVFLCLNEDERAELKREEKRVVQIELLREAHCEKILIEELNALRQCELLALETPVLVNPGIRKGDRVLITSGTLKGLETEVLRRDGESGEAVIVNLPLLNTHVEYPISAEILEKITM